MRGKIAIVTGATSGIGLAIACRPTAFAGQLGILMAVGMRSELVCNTVFIV